jgi:hypothetical protein
MTVAICLRYSLACFWPRQRAIDRIAIYAGGRRGSSPGNAITNNVQTLDKSLFSSGYAWQRPSLFCWLLFSHGYQVKLSHVEERFPSCPDVRLLLNDTQIILAPRNRYICIRLSCINADPVLTVVDGEKILSRAKDLCQEQHLWTF